MSFLKLLVSLVNFIWQYERIVEHPHTNSNYAIRKVYIEVFFGVLHQIIDDHDRWQWSVGVNQRSINKENVPYQPLVYWLVRVLDSVHDRPLVVLHAQSPKERPVILRPHVVLN